MGGSEDEKERSDMVDPREETPGLSDHTEFTETRDPSTTQQAAVPGGAHEPCCCSRVDAKFI